MAGRRTSTQWFLFLFLPILCLLAAGYWTLNQRMERRVRNDLRSSLGQQREALARQQVRGEFQAGRIARLLREDRALAKLLTRVPLDRRALESRLREISESFTFDLLLVSASTGKPVAGVIRDRRNLVPFESALAPVPEHGFFAAGGRTFQLASAELEQGSRLTVGEPLDFASLAVPLVLARNEKVVKSSLRGVSRAEAERALDACRGKRGCEFDLAGETWLIKQMDVFPFGEGYRLWSFQNMDGAGAAQRAELQQAFLLMALGAALISLLGGGLLRRWVSRPLLGMRDWLDAGEGTQAPEAESQIVEVHKLMESFRRMSEIRRGEGERWRRSWLEIAGALASAVDARNPYTAGHSLRVSEYACAIADSIELPPGDIEQLRVAALLHDIGKITIPDRVLEKPGCLSVEEFARIKEHPCTARRLLDGVSGFERCLPAIELHHENWDGSGYPLGLAGVLTPLEARIVRVADAYDAMTSERPYRPAMSHEEALRILEQNAGTQFDPGVVSVFAELDEIARGRREGSPGVTRSVERLAAAVNSASAAAESVRPVSAE